MGGTQSTRKITLVNDEKAGVIKLSESLANRLWGQIEGQKSVLSDTSAEGGSVAGGSEAAKVAAPLVLQPPSSLPPSVKHASPLPAAGQMASIVQPIVPSSDFIGAASRVGEPSQQTTLGGALPPWAIYAEEAQIMLNKLKEDKDAEIADREQQWNIKLENREKEFVQMNSLTQDHISSSLKEVEALFVKVSCTPVCQDQQEKVMTCYQDHSRQTLSCAKEVENFSRCVDLSRLQAVMKGKS